MNFLEEAIKEAKKAYKKAEIPVGCVIEKDGVIISKGHNLRETKNNSLAHAEIIAINKACKKLKNWRLDECEMYVTLHPCLMCSGAIISSRIKKVYFGAYENNMNKTFVDQFKNYNIFEYVENKECSTLLVDFFKDLRCGKIKKINKKL